MQIIESVFGSKEKTLDGIQSASEINQALEKFVDKLKPNKYTKADLDRECSKKREPLAKLGEQLAPNIREILKYRIRKTEMYSGLLPNIITVLNLFI